MPFRFNGRNTPIKQPNRYTGGPGKPDTTIEVYKGLKTSILGMIQMAKDRGYEWNVTEGPGPLATIEMSSPTLNPQDPGTEAPINTWELVPGEVEKNVLDADIASIAGTSQSTGIPQADKDLLRYFQQNPPPDGKDPTPLMASNNAKALYRLMQKGLHAVVIFAPVLRHTTNVSTAWTTKASVTNVGRIMNTAYLLANENVDPNLLIPLNGPPFTNTAVDTNLKYGWLKKYPTIIAAANSRRQISQEWAFGLWSPLVYDTLLTA